MVSPSPKIKLQTLPSLQAAPSSPSGWIELALSWLLVNVVWGLIPLLVTLFFALLIGMTPNFGNELRVGFTVLALGLCGTQLIDDVQIPQSQLIKWKWLKNFSIIVVVFGALASAVNILHGNPDLKTVKINLELLNLCVWIVVVSALFLSFWAFLIRTLAASESFKQVVDEQQRALIAQAESQSQVNGIQL